MRNLLLVGLGGAIGACARYLLGGWVMRLMHEPRFPWGTLVVNVLGCLLIGWLAGLMVDRGLFGPSFRLLVLIGILGGFTTFSSFGLETWTLLQDHEFGGAMLNAALQLGLGLGAVVLGATLARIH